MAKKYRIEDEDDICPKTRKRHRPDWKTVTTEYDADEIYVDVSCQDCGRSGCVGTSASLAEGICW
jgi:hypothetical protein